MTSLDSLRNILELERSKGYTNKAVIGGLDEYLHRQADSIAGSVSSTSLLEQLEQTGLRDSCYASLSHAERRDYIARLLAWIVTATRHTSYDASALACAPGKRPTRARRKGTAPLDSAITVIKGITPTVAAKFGRLGVHTLQDMLYFFPRRYIDYSLRTPIAELVEGREQTVLGTVWQTRLATLGRRKGTEAIVGDNTGTTRVVWFNQPYLAKRLPINAQVVLSGTVGTFKSRKVLESPEWELVKEGELIHTGRLVPIYPLTSGLYARRVRRWVKEVVDDYTWQLVDFLPEAVRRRCKLLGLHEAIGQIHFPDNWRTMEQARERLVFDELFLLQLGVLDRKRDWQESQPGNLITHHPDVATRFLDSLPFSLTRAQQQAMSEVIADLQSPKAMSRLLQGEVGSGKTVVATMALLMAVANGYQGALMAPTEVLAEQHFSTLASHLSVKDTTEDATGPAETVFSELATYLRQCPGLLPRPVAIGLLIGSLREQEKDDIRNRAAQGKIDILVGTHAVIQRGVEFHRLGLAVIDEQQRFGVLQRSALRQKGSNPHVLVTTATPIPRTMALTIYGDLDLSFIDELPPGRQRVKTKYLEPDELGKAYTFVSRRVRDGEQAFIICPLIDESDSFEGKAAVSEYEYLSKKVFPDLRLGLLHGRMPSDEKEQVMRRFSHGDIEVLISTSVVEVGIDVPRATVILVQGADHFGLSQLHQLRGRVGRRARQGYCLLVPSRPSSEARQRLRLMERVQDGFTLAEKDLELRGPGEFFGTHQSGLPELRVAKLTNLRVVETVRREATALFSRDRGLERPEHRVLKEQIAQMWSRYAEWS